MKHEDSELDHGLRIRAFRRVAQAVRDLDLCDRRDVLHAALWVLADPPSAAQCDLRRALEEIRVHEDRIDELETQLADSAAEQAFLRSVDTRTEAGRPSTP